MALVDFLFDNVESFFAWSSLLLKQSHASYCDLETADSQHVLVTKNGSLISVIKIDGFRRFVGKSEFDQLCQRFVESIQTAFSSEGHFIQIYFNYSPENISYYINEALHSAKETAERVCLSIDDIFESRKKVLEDVCSHEDCFLSYGLSHLHYQLSTLRMHRKINWIKLNHIIYQMQDVLQIYF
ncbi:hypothetical protein [Piscirickettsia salmonis]|uniref:hypothetical protein n=1 Tax=Piscirickettsia salmonis TaxID=1238 RepID=UPI000A5963E7|nr:hypothetical protein [Piscirickettsia salmonis]